LLAWKKLVDRKHEVPKGVLFCGGMAMVIAAVGALLAFFMKMQGNWLIFAYPTAFILLSWYAIDGTRWKKKVLQIGLVFSIALVALVFCLPYVQSQGSDDSKQIPYKINPFKHNVGWDQLASALKTAGYDSERDFLFADKYQTVSELSFYGPFQKRAYFFNLQGARKNQFSYWKGAEQEVGKRGFFVVVENMPYLGNESLPSHYQHLLEPYFQKVNFLGIQPLFKAYGKTVKGAMIFEVEGHNGKLPAETDLY